MQCKICALSNSNLINDIEHRLANNDGQLFKSDFEELKKAYPALSEVIDKISQQDCLMHYNFHQTTARQIPAETDAGALSSIESAEESESRKGKSLTEDIGKDEANVLYDLLNQQAATFTALTKKLNKAITNSEKEPNALLIHAETRTLYTELAASMRQTVREIRELDTAKNGKEDSASEGLKMLARALAPQPTTNDRESKPNIPLREEDDLTTKEFDD